MEMVLVIANILLVVATLALVGVTGYYARHTNRMADVMYKDYELRTTPLADIKIMIAGVSKPRLSFLLIVTNKGYCRIRIKSIQWSWWNKIQQEVGRIPYTLSPCYEWLSEWQPYQFHLPEVNIPEKYWVPEFNPFQHIAIDGWVECESPIGIVKRYEIKTNL